MKEYNVYGPFKIPTIKKKMGKVIDNPTKFWESLPPNAKKIKLKNKPGIYVFAMSFGHSIKPYYVGKTTKSFEKECFKSHQKNKYAEALTNYKRGTPVLFLIAKPTENTINKNQVKNMENFFIQLAINMNQDLLNIQGTKQPKWSIRGVIRSKGKSSGSAIKFKNMMDI